MQNLIKLKPEDLKWSYGPVPSAQSVSKDCILLFWKIDADIGILDNYVGLIYPYFDGTNYIWVDFGKFNRWGTEMPVGWWACIKDIMP